MNIIKIQEELESIISKHQDLIGREAKNLEAEYSIGTAEITKEAIQKIDGGDRLLQIGILGRVKAGKSSLLNALLFDGRDILPKAAIPMTAALTIISYGKKLSAEVEFFKQKDIEHIEKEAKAYEYTLEKLKNKVFLELQEQQKRRDEKIQVNDEKGIIDRVKDKTQELFNNNKLRTKAIKRANREMKSNISLVSSFDQWQRIKASNVNYRELSELKKVDSDSLKNLSHELLQYVGADGKYMPFTKSVHIKIPQKNLKNIQIVDTPGINDPVQSREERTRELLKFCDVVFIVSSSGQFMSNEDLNLMDRITSKEGIRELYVIASQVDLQLFGSIKEESSGKLYQAFKKLTNTLAEQLHNTLTTLKETNPEIGSVYDSLIKQSRQKVIHSSGICLSIKEDFNRRKNWDEGVNTAWENLTRHYPDYFSDNDEKLSIANLDLLANITTINNIIEEVKEKKESILETRKQEFMEVKFHSLMKYKQALLSHIDEKVESINNGSIEELKTEQKKLLKIKERVSNIIDEEYYDIVKSLEINIKKELMSQLKDYFREAKEKVNDAEGSETESYEYDHGFWSWKFFNSRYETRHNTYTTARTGAIRSSLENLTWEIEDSIETKSISFIQNWKKSLTQGLVKILRENVNDDELNLQNINKVIRTVLNSIEYPEMEYSGKLPTSLSVHGTLTGNRAEEFISDAQKYISSLKSRVKDDINSYLKQLISALNNIEISQSIFGDYDAILKQLEEEVSNMSITLDRLSKIKNQIEKVS